MNIGFTKMHGLGNDFVVIDNMNGRIELSAEQVVFLCNRFKGIGADGVILVEKSDIADCFMNYINADGSFAQMCGNGVRCTAKFLKDEVLKNKVDFKIETRSGIKNIDCMDDGTFSVNMGKASFAHSDFPENSMRLYDLDLDFVSMGNPFAIMFVEDLKKYDVSFLGPLVENHKLFPNRMNLEIAQLINPDLIKVNVWERGCGPTLACGTGACAVYALAKKKNIIGKEIIIELPGGKLFMSENENEEIIMRGPAVSVFSSIIEI